MKNDYRDYLEHGLFKYVKKIFKNGKPRYIYADDIKTKVGKKLYDQTVAWKQAEADRTARTKLVPAHNGKKVSNNTYVDHEDHFPFATAIEGNKHQIGSVTYWKDSKGEQRRDRTQFNVGDDMITYKDLKDTLKRNRKNKSNYKKFKRKQKFDNFMEKHFGIVDLDKLKKRIKSREDSKELIRRYKAKGGK